METGRIPALDASKLATGTLTDDRLSTNVALLSAGPRFAGPVSAPAFSGSGAGLTALDAGNITGGTLADERLSADVARHGAANSFAASNQFSGVVIATNAENQFAGLFSGHGGGLTNLPATALTGILSSVQLPALDATQITSGIFSDGRLSTNIPRLSTDNDFAGALTATRFAGNGAVPWQTVTGTSQSAAVNTSYLLVNDQRSTVTLPAAANVGDLVRVSGAGAGGWMVVPGAGNSIAGYGVRTWLPRENNRFWSAVAASADASKLVATVSFGGRIYVSQDAGETWSASNENRHWETVAMSADGDKLIAAEYGGQIYSSTDAGASWIARDSIRNWISIASSADGVKLFAAVWGGRLFVSTDSGETWSPRENNRYWRYVASSADGTKLVALDYFGSTMTGGQIYTSADSGAHWTARENNRHWRSVASSADGVKLVAVEEGGRIYTSADSGATWTAREENRAWQSVTASADGEKLAAIVWGGQIHTSTDGGLTWVARENLRSWQCIAASADGVKLVAAASEGRIYTSTIQGDPSQTGALFGNLGEEVTLQNVGGGLWQPLNALNGAHLIAGTITDAAISPTAAIADEKLATLSTPGKVANSATSATSANAPGTIVARDAGGNFSAGAITASTFFGDGAGLTALSGANISAGTITDAAIAPNAGIPDTKLATLGTAGKVANSATTATSSNAVDAIVARDATGSFAAGSLTLDGSLNLPVTSAAGGFISVGGTPVFHAAGENFAAGRGAGSLAMGGTGNTAIGNLALAATTVGERNSAVGAEALTANIGGSDNLAIGHRALSAAETASFNVAVGNAALQFNTGSNNIAVGHAAAADLTNGSGNISIGHRGVPAEDNTIRIGAGEIQTRTFVAGILGVTTGVNDAVPVVVDSNGQLGTISSSRRYKEEITDMGDLSERLMSLRPVTFRYRRPYTNGDKPVQFGLIAEEVAEVFPELAVRNAQGQPETVKYQDLTPLLVNEVKKLRARNAEVEKEFANRTAALEQQVAELRKLLEAVTIRR